MHNFNPNRGTVENCSTPEWHGSILVWAQHDPNMPGGLLIRAGSDTTDVKCGQGRLGFIYNFIHTLNLLINSN